ncbi:MAG: glycoside hydrolase family 65 protein [Ilumatobacteraceae bacterium]|nr:glycoside hydrolase family 65 protein [Ilumatobacteraceae bacterium]
MNDWLWTYDSYDAAREGLREALCTLGNGVLATRGALAECAADGDHYPGTYVAGIFNRLTDEVAGREIVNESLVNIPNWLPLRVRVDGGEWIAPQRHHVEDHRIELDLHRGVLTRRTVFEVDDDTSMTLTERRIVSLADPHLAALQSTIVIDRSAVVEVEAGLDGMVENGNVQRYNDLATDHLEHVRTEQVADDIVVLEVRTNDSGIDIAEAQRMRVGVDGSAVAAERVTRLEPRLAAQQVRVEVDAEAEVIVEKVVSIHTGRDLGIYSTSDAVVGAVRSAPDFDTLLGRHLTAWSHAWSRCKVTVAGDVDDTARILNLHIFHVLSTLSENTTELDVGVPARGLHGEAYRGHIFWDELYIFPFVTLRIPELTRALLRYRARRLPRARLAAVADGFSGAMYPWQSGSDGREETQVLHLNPKSGHWLPDASHLQRHVNIAIAYNVWQYWLATGDHEFMRLWGAEMMLEIARFWASTTTYNHSLDRYEINGVMGPDEFHEAYPDRDDPGLNNNSYTNVMAVWCLSRAFDVIELLPTSRRRELLERLSISNDELDRWGDISRKMRLVFHADGILSQFEGYEDLEELDWDKYHATYGNIGRLDRILEAEGDSTNRYKLAKQADTLMLLQMLSPLEIAELWERLGYDFEPDMVARYVNYYEARTSHGSTLSKMVHAWLHARLDPARSWDLFRQALVSDVSDVQGGTTREGVHLGVMAGTVDLVQRCYGGVDLRAGVLAVDPALPAPIERLEFAITYHRHFVHLEIDRSTVRVRLADDKGELTPITVSIRGAARVMKPGDTFERALT